MSSITRAAIERYDSCMPHARKAAATDPHYAYHRQLLLQILETADMAMEDEGIPEGSRRRVISTILYGGPSEADAILREQDRQLFAEAMKAKPTLKVHLGDLPGGLDGLVKP